MTTDASFSRIATTIDGAEVVARVGGSGPGLLLLHGFPQTHRAWRHADHGASPTPGTSCPRRPPTSSSTTCAAI